MAKYQGGFKPNPLLTLIAKQQVMVCADLYSTKIRNKLEQGLVFSSAFLACVVLSYHDVKDSNKQQQKC